MLPTKQPEAGLVNQGASVHSTQKQDAFKQQASGQSSTTYKDEQFFVAPSDLTNSENGGLKFKTCEYDIKSELERVFADLQELTKCPLAQRLNMPEPGRTAAERAEIHIYDENMQRGWQQPEMGIVFGRAPLMN